MIEILIKIYTHIYFRDPEHRTQTFIEEWGILGRGITTGPNAQVALNMWAKG